MTSEMILEKLNDIFRNVFDDDALQITAETSADDIEEWDSLAHITIIALVEKKFNVVFTTREIEEMKKIGDMMAVISEKIKQ